MDVSIVAWSSLFPFRSFRIKYVVTAVHMRPLGVFGMAQSPDAAFPSADCQDANKRGMKIADLIT